MPPSGRHASLRREKRPSSGFDFTLHARLLCDDMVRRLPELRHVDLARVAISFSQTRKAVDHGLYASLTPLRFTGGSETTIRHGRKWTIQRLVDPSGREMLYLLSFYLPRFLNQTFRHKLTTVVHELWHVSPRCDGDLRRFGGRCYAHTGSQKQYDAKVERLTDRWLALDPPASVYDFLRYDFRELVRRYGKVYGTKIRAPKLIPVA
jgi:predicted metallopeptidase